MFQSASGRLPSVRIGTGLPRRGFSTFRIPNSEFRIRTVHPLPRPRRTITIRLGSWTRRQKWVLRPPESRIPAPRATGPATAALADGSPVAPPAPNHNDTLMVMAAQAQMRILAPGICLGVRRYSLTTSACRFSTLSQPASVNMVSLKSPFLSWPASTPSAYRRRSSVRIMRTLSATAFLMMSG